MVPKFGSDERENQRKGFHGKKKRTEWGNAMVVGKKKKKNSYGGCPRKKC